MDWLYDISLQLAALLGTGAVLVGTGLGIAIDNRRSE